MAIYAYYPIVIRCIKQIKFTLKCLLGGTWKYLHSTINQELTNTQVDKSKLSKQGVCFFN